MQVVKLKETVQAGRVGVLSIEDGRLVNNEWIFECIFSVGDPKA